MTHDIDERELKTAIELYVQESYSRHPDYSSKAQIILNGIEERVDYLKEQIRRGFAAECVLGLPPRWEHARIRIKIDFKDRYSFWVDTNDDGDENDLNCDKAKNQEYKRRIEKAWKDVGLPVRED